jgi:hypothetical protein
MLRVMAFKGNSRNVHKKYFTALYLYFYVCYFYPDF